MPTRFPVTGALAALGLVGGFAVAVATGSRPLGGGVLVLFAVPCVWIWRRRDGRAVAARLSAAGVLAFAISHALGLLIGAWAAVLVVSVVMVWLSWRWSDRRQAAGASASVRAGSASA